jgi:FG-GAP repeat/Kre9/KNH-like N-terminal Ig-like domain
MIATRSDTQRGKGREGSLPLILIVSILFAYALPCRNMKGTSISSDSSSADIVPLPPGPDVTVLGPATLTRLGGSGAVDNLSDLNHSQALVFGDFNGDGIADLAIGAPDAMLAIGSTQRNAAGAVYVIFGRRDLPAVIDTAAGLAGGVNVTILGAADGDRFGFALAAGDVNGDGVADLIIGAPGANAPTRSDAGAVYVFLGSHSFGSNATLDLAQGGAADLTIYGTGERFGAAVATGDAGGPAGNIPIADMLIGAPGAGLDSPGAAYLVYGRAAFGSQTRIIDLAAGGADFTLRGDIRQHLGVSVAIGDFNGDHLGDLFAGAPAASRPDRVDQTVSLAPASLTGAVFGVLGPFPQGGALNITNTAALLSFYGGGTGDQFGTAISTADLSGDGVADLVIGAPEVGGVFLDPTDGSPYTLNGHAGAAYVFAGRPGLLQRRFDAAANEYLTVYIGLGFSWVGFSVSAGNYNVPGNADIIPDLLIGRPGGVRGTGSNIGGVGGVNVVFGGHTLGSVRLRPRSPFNPPAQPDEVWIGNPPFGLNTDFGFAVAAGDLNGDTSGDLVTALPFATVAGRQQAGVVEVRFGTVKPAGGEPGDSPATVRVLSPFGGDHYQAGQQVGISWDATGRDKVRSFDILLSTDAGATFSTSIATGLSADQSSFTWTVPSLCAGSARLQVVANTSGGEKVVSTSNGSFSIEQRGPGVDLTKSSISADSLVLSSVAGESFADDVTVELSTDAQGTSYAAFARPPKLKSGGRMLKTRGTLGGMDLDQFFPDGATRYLKLSAAPCATTILKVRRVGDSLVSVAAD